MKHTLIALIYIKSLLYCLGCVYIAFTWGEVVIPIKLACVIVLKLNIWLDTQKKKGGPCLQTIQLSAKKLDILFFFTTFTQ